MAAITSAVIGGGAAIYGAKKSASAAKSAATAATPTPYGVSGPAGTVGIDPRTKQIRLSQAQNPFGNMFTALGAQGLAGAGAGFGEIGDAYQGLFGSGLTDQIQNQYGLLSQIAAPGENRERLGLDDQLFARGQLGTSGGAERFRALMESQQQADLQRQLAAVGLGQQTAQNRFEGALASQQQNFNIGQGAFGGLQQLFQNLLAQGNLGLGAMSGTPSDIAQYAAQASGGPFQAGFNALNQGGVFDRLGGMFNRGPTSGPLSPVPQPAGGVNIGTRPIDLGNTNFFPGA